MGEYQGKSIVMFQSRLSWDAMLMQIADVLGPRSSCLHHHIGCVFVDELHRIITVGYNGSSRGDVNCNEVGCAKLDGDPQSGVLRRCRGAHSEINAILNCLQPERLRGCTLYITTFPCYACMKALVQAGIAAIVYRDEYLRLDSGGQREREDEAEELATRMGIQVRKYEAVK
jgi:dCMP deaminase